MQELIHNAQICFIPTFQSTGLKLKLLGSLFASRFVVTNSAMVKNTGLEELCEVYDEPEELKNCILSTFSKSFSEEDILKRKAVFGTRIFKQNKCKKVIYYNFKQIQQIGLLMKTVIYSDHIFDNFWCNKCARL